MTRALAVLLLLAGASGAGGVAAAAPAMRKGPYLQDVEPGAVTVMYELDASAPSRVVLTGPDGEHALDVPAARIAQAKLTGLAPATRYRYRVTAGDGAWTGELATAPAHGADVPFSFVVLGDSRSNVEAHRRVVERISAQEVPDFVLGTGDMVDDGSHEDQWQEFFDVEGPLIRDNAFYPALGNHDRQGRGKTADTYRAYFAVPDDDSLGGGEPGRFYAFTYATARVLVLDSNEYSFALTDQTAWLERELIAARQDPAIQHVFCVMHHPAYSVSLHGGQRDLRERWTPLFEAYQVTAVFAGHDHVYERAEAGGIHYFVTGGGGAPLYPRRTSSSPIDTAAVVSFERALHYLRVTVHGARIEVTAVRADGTTIETTSWVEPARAPMPAAAAATVGSAAVRAPAAPIGTSRTRDGDGRDRDGDGSGVAWPALAGAVVLLAAAFALVRALRR